MFNDDFWGDYSESEEPEALLGAYEDLKNGSPSRMLDEEDYEQLIEYFFQNNKEAEALKACELAKSFYPYSVSLWLLEAEVLLQSEKFGQALKILDALDEFSGNQVDAILLRSDIFLAQLKAEQAIKFLKEKIPFFEGEEKIELLLELSDVYDEHQDAEAVFYTLKRILKMSPENEEALHKISFWADFSALHNESIALHKSLIELNPFNPLVWYNLGVAYQGLKDDKKAIDAYEYCVALDEKFEAAYRNIADSYIKLNQYDEALECLKKNLELGQPEELIFEAMGHCFEMQKDFSRARYYYHKVIHLNPTDDLIFFRVGETYAKEAQWEKAAESYSKALTLNKDNVSCILALGNCLLELDADLEALTCFMAAVSLKPNNKGTWAALITGLYHVELYEEMLEDIEAARDAIGDKSDFEFFSALALFALGKVKSAMLHLEEGLVRAPKRVKLLLHLNPELLKSKSVSELIAKYYKQKR